MRMWRLSLYTCLWVHVCDKSLQSCPLFATLWTVARQASPSIEFSRQEYWSGMPCTPPGGHPHPGIEFCCSSRQVLYHQRHLEGAVHMPGSLTIQTWETPKYTLLTPLCLSGHRMWELHSLWLQKVNQECGGRGWWWLVAWSFPSLSCPLSPPLLGKKEASLSWLDSSRKPLTELLQRAERYLVKKELRLKWESYLQTKKDQTRVLVKRRWDDFFQKQCGWKQKNLKVKGSVVSDSATPWTVAH